MKHFRPLLFWALAALVVACVKIPDNVTAVQHLDAERYMGRWYEVARSAHRFERNMDNVTATYTMGEDGRINVRNQGYRTDKGEWDSATAKAYLVGEPHEGRLKVSFFGPFYSGYNIIGLDAGHQNALVVGNDLSYVWLLSRTPQMPVEVRNTYMARLHELGVDTTALIRVKHDRMYEAPTP
jgi:apolipoprotein D and lipocalin family protein